MKIQYCSDLHLEFSQNREFIEKNPLKIRADILVLAGDICSLSDINAVFFDFCSDNFQKTYWICGNHEYYGYDISKKSQVLFEKIRHNVILVNDIKIDKLVFSTMWSKISNPSVQYRINDFRKIKNGDKILSIEDFNNIHAKSLTFLKENVKQGDVVVTHHLPTFINYPVKYLGDVLNEAFAVELSDFIKQSKPAYWIYGHNHNNEPDFKVGETTLTTNQLGYSWFENLGFTTKIIEI